MIRVALTHTEIGEQFQRLAIVEMHGSTKPSAEKCFARRTHGGVQPE